MRMIKNYINGKWVGSRSIRVLDVENPGTGEILAKVPMSTKEEVDLAVGAAKKAFEEWKDMPITQRVRYLFKLKILVEEHLEELATLITKEHGKVLSDTRAEIQRLMECIEASFTVPSLIQGNILHKITRDIDEYYIREPIGVIAHIAPFNFPGMIPFWYLPFVVACGNTFIIKPSEQVPLTMNRIFELIDQAGFPKGVLGLVNGDKEVVDALLKHQDVAGICSVTSTPTAQKIYEKCGRYGKRPLCQAGAKNFLVVMPSCKLEQAVPSIIDSVYGNTNQRCLAGANVVGVGEVYHRMLKMIFEAVPGIKVGYGLDSESTMGPLISHQAKERTLRYIERGIEEGARLLIDGRDVKVENYPKGHYLGPSVFVGVNPEMTIAKEEIFGPVMTVLKAGDLDEAIGWINKSEYGNGAIIYTSSGKEEREFILRVHPKNIGVNIGLPAPIALFPFGGTKKSFFGVLHGQLPDIIDFCTDKKVVIRRFW
jgi:malonate-semialdehyde dehydrogenase (acetylating)/methylmalonate-semialdehyde dehydrogenase